jgi:type IV secretory pathway TrbD component
MLSQVLGTAVAGIAGGWYARVGLPAHSARVRAGSLALVAVIVTALFDLVTNVATGLVFGQMKTWLIAGIPFSLWHIGYNVLLFVAVGTPLVAVFARYSARLAA